MEPDIYQRYFVSVSISHIKKGNQVRTQSLNAELQGTGASNLDLTFKMSSQIHKMFDRLIHACCVQNH